MDWKKEYKFSDLFRRPKKDRQRAIPAAGETAASDAPVAAASPLDDVPIWKKEIKLSSLFRRKKSPKTPTGPLALPPVGDTVPEAPMVAETILLPEHEHERVAGAAATVAAASVEAEPAPTQVSPTAEELPASTEAADSAPTVETPQADRAQGPSPVEQAPAAEAPAEPAPSEPEPAPQSVAPETPAASETPAEPAPKVPWYKKELGGAKKSKQKPVADAGPERKEKKQQPKGQQAPERGPTKTGDLSRLPLMKAMNLLPKDVQLAKRSQVRPVFIQAAAVFAAVLVAGGVGLLYRSQHTTLHHKQGALEDLKAQVTEVQAEVVAARQSAANGTSLAGEALTRATALSIPLNARVNWDRLLRELSVTLPSGVWFNTMATDATTSTVPSTTGSTVTAALSIPSNLTITGYALDQDGVGRLLARLGVIPEFSTVQLQTAAEAQLNGQNVIQFTVIGQLKPPAGAASSEAALQAAAAASQPATTTSSTTTSGSDE